MKFILKNSDKHVEENMVMISRPNRSIVEYSPVNLAHFPAVPSLKYIGRAPYTADKAVHLITKVGLGVDRDAFEREFNKPGLENFRKFKTYVSLGPRPYHLFMEQDEKTNEYLHTDNRYRLNLHANNFKERYNNLQLSIANNNSNCKGSLYEVKDQKFVTEQFNDIFPMLFDEEILEERLRNQPDFIVNLIPNYDSEEMRLIKEKDYFRKGAYIIEIHDSAEWSVIFPNMLTDITSFIDEERINGFIIQSPERKIGVLMNGLLPESLGLVSFMKSIYPDINLLIIVMPPRPEEMEKAQAELVRSYAYLHDKYNIDKNDIINKNGSRGLVVDKIIEKMNYLQNKT